MIATSTQTIPETQPPWPPALPLRPSLYGLRIRRETNPMIRAEGGHFYGESTVSDGLSTRQLDILQAIAGGAPVDQDDPGVQGMKS